MGSGSRSTGPCDEWEIAYNAETMTQNSKLIHSLERTELDGGVELSESQITHTWLEAHLSCPGSSLKRNRVHPAWCRMTGITTHASEWVGGD